MAETRLDQIVKGAPPPDTSKEEVVAVAVKQSSILENAEELEDEKKPGALHTDPLSLLPSSPPQIYLNLLILEASLRSQYLTLRARRRQHTFFLFLLALWNCFFFYALFFRPREDGKGVGGSVYWVVDMGEKVAFMGGVLTAVLIWGTGQWERGVRWPRRWLGVTNRGIRGMNLKVVILKGPWYRRLLSYLAFLFPYSSFFPSQGSSYHLIEYPEKRDQHIHRHANARRPLKEEDVASGGDHIKLLLLPKHFSPDFRENWDLYRSEYWERENERRAELRKIVKRKKRELAKQQGGWLWWTGWRGWKRIKIHEPVGDVEKVVSHSHRHAKDGRHRSASLRQGGSHSRSSSRSSYAQASDVEDAPAQHSRTRSLKSSLKPLTGSSSSSNGRPNKASSHRRKLSILKDEILEDESASTSTADKRLSMISNASSDPSDGELSERSTTSSAYGRERSGSRLRSSRHKDSDSNDIS